MKSSYIQQPRHIVISQVNKISNQEYQNQNKSDLTTTIKSVKLPSLHQQWRQRRFKTQIDKQGVESIKQMSTQLNGVNNLKRSNRQKMPAIYGQLAKKISVLSRMGLISGGAVKTIIYSGHIRMPTVHNDYHNSKTNAGYSRNKYGGIYPK